MWEQKITPGDFSVFEELVSRYYKKIFTAAMALTANEEDSRDLTQETFVGAYKGFGRFQGKSSFYTWLYRIFLNQYFKYLRGRKKQRFQPLEYAGDNGESTKEYGDTKYLPTHMVDEKEKKEVVLDAVRTLPDEMRVVVIMRYLEDMSCEEIAKNLGCPLGTIKSRLFNARALLKERLKDYEL